MRNILFATVISCFLVGCGGGGGGDSVKSYAGDWYLSTVVVVNDCYLPVPPIESFAHRVNQNNTIVVVNELSGAGSGTYAGEMDEDGESFTTVGQNKYNGSCVSNESIVYSNLDGDKADVAIAAVIVCDNGSSCTLVYAGVAER